jgi:hypothetical protein
MRRLLTVAVLGAVVTLLFVLGRAAEDWHYVVEGQPGALMYVATFDDFTADWQTYDGRLAASIADGGLRIENGLGDTYAFSVARPHFRDFDLRLDASAVSGPENNGYGVIFRYQDQGNFYMFLVSSDGYYSVTRVTDGDQTPLSNWIDTPLVTRGFDAPNFLRVIGQGDRFRFFVNNQAVQLCIPNDPGGISTYNAGQCFGGTMRDELTDVSIASGQIGVVTLSLDEADVVAQFDNLLVYQPAA